jgi:hypothetical protein
MSRSADASALARDHTEKAISTIAEVMDDPFAENRDRLRAAETILDRGHGKPLAATIQIPMNRQQAELLASMSDDDLLSLIQQARLPRLADAVPEPAEPPLEADFHEVAPEHDPLLD